MDILAHTLWAGAGARGANSVNKNKFSHINIGWAAFWGVFPDLFAFMIPIVLRFYFVVFGQSSASSFFIRTNGGMSGVEDGFNIVRDLYQYSHSLIIFAIVFFVAWIFYRRPRFELLGWVLHILIDIPSHTLAFYPTPFLFPISNYKFPYGIQWSSAWFMIINYSLLLVVWGRFLVKDLIVKKPNKN